MLSEGQSIHCFIILRIFFDHLLIPFFLRLVIRSKHIAQGQLIIKRKLRDFISLLVPFVTFLLAKSSLFLFWSEAYKYFFVIFWLFLDDDLKKLCELPVMLCLNWCLGNHVLYLCCLMGIQITFQGAFKEFFTKSMYFPIFLLHIFKFK